MTMYEFLRYVAGELRCGWSVIIHGPEFWLATAIWGIGACCGIIFSWVMVAISDKATQENTADQEDNDEH